MRDEPRNTPPFNRAARPTPTTIRMMDEPRNQPPFKLPAR
jgi:hypothetical protein